MTETLGGFYYMEDIMSEIIKLKKKINQMTASDIEVTEENGAVKLHGEVSNWNEVLQFGKLAAKTSYRGVINNLSVKGSGQDNERIPLKEDDILKDKEVDVCIIGGGIIGSAIFSALSKYDFSVLLLEKENDLACHQSSRNNSMVHPGVNPKAGSLKAHYNVLGNAMYPELAANLNVPYRNVGTIVMFDSRLMKTFGNMLLVKAKKNNVPGVRRMSRKEIMKREPYISDKVVGGIYMPTTGVCPPYEMTIALAEHGVINGNEVSLETYVKGFEKTGDKIDRVITNRGTIKSKVIINAAGLFSDKIAEAAGDRFFTIHPRKGDIALLDKKTGQYLDCVTSIVSIQTALGNTKGGGLVKTAEGNILVGPSAYEQPIKEDYATTKEGLRIILDKNLPYVTGIDKTDVITYLAGNRACTYKEDFIVEKSKKVTNLIHVAGIQSPGYASAPAIAKDVAQFAIEQLESQNVLVNQKHNYTKHRNKNAHILDLSFEQRQQLIKKNPSYGHIICRCEEISEGEIREAVNGIIPALTVDSVKRRTRSGMGRCQGGFCSPLVAKIIQEETGRSYNDILQKGGPLSDEK